LSDNHNNILSSMDLFIEKIQQLRGMMLGVSFSALILAPLAIGISLYLVTHPKFFQIIEQEQEFAILLMILVTVVLITSGIWLVAGIQQFKSLNSWNKRYCGYLKKRDDLDKEITSKFHLDEE